MPGGGGGVAPRGVPLSRSWVELSRPIVVTRTAVAWSYAADGLRGRKNPCRPEGRLAAVISNAAFPSDGGHSRDASMPPGHKPGAQAARGSTLALEQHHVAPLRLFPVRLL